MSFKSHYQALLDSLGSDYKSIQEQLEQVEAPDPALIPWFAAWAKRKTQRINIVLHGASLIDGAYVTSFDKTVGQHLAQNLRGGAVGGQGRIDVPTVFSEGIIDHGGQWVFNGGTLDSDTFGWGIKHNIWYDNIGGHYSRLDLDFPVTSFDIEHLLNPYGLPAAGYYKIDGGVSVPFDTYAAANTEQTFNVPDPATSSIEIGVNAGVGVPTGYTDLLGLRLNNGDENFGVQVHNAGHGGYTIDEWAAGAGGPNVFTAIHRLNPDLLVLSDLGVNDGEVDSAATFETKLVDKIADHRAAGDTCPILLCAVWNIEATFPFIDAWADYVAVMRDVAADDPTVAFLDIGAKMPPVTPDIYDLYEADNAHGNSDGSAYLMMADIIAKKIKF